MGWARRRGARDAARSWRGLRRPIAPPDLPLPVQHERTGARGSARRTDRGPEATRAPGPFAGSTLPAQSKGATAAPWWTRIQ